MVANDTRGRRSAGGRTQPRAKGLESYGWLVPLGLALLVVASIVFVLKEEVTSTEIATSGAGIVSEARSIEHQQEKRDDRCCTEIIAPPSQAQKQEPETVASLPETPNSASVTAAPQTREQETTASSPEVHNSGPETVAALSETEKSAPDTAAAPPETQNLGPDTVASSSDGQNPGPKPPVPAAKPQKSVPKTVAPSKPQKAGPNASSSEAQKSGPGTAAPKPAVQKSAPQAGAPAPAAQTSEPATAVPAAPQKSEPATAQAPPATAPASPMAQKSEPETVPPPSAVQTSGPKAVTLPSEVWSSEPGMAAPPSAAHTPTSETAAPTPEKQTPPETQTPASETAAPPPGTQQPAAAAPTPDARKAAPQTAAPPTNRKPGAKSVAPQLKVEKSGPKIAAPPTEPPKSNEAALPNMDKPGSQPEKPPEGTTPPKTNEPALPQLTLSDDVANRVGHQIWMNETGGNRDAITSWNVGEEFASLGIGHFIWFPSGKKATFDEDFPRMLVFLRDHSGAHLPSWVDKTPIPPCPWPTRADFMKEFNSHQTTELREFLLSTMAGQAQFLVARAQESLEKILASTSDDTQRKHIVTQLRRVTDASKDLYPLIDYINFKGDGTDPAETVLDKQTGVRLGWGLKQVLLSMTGTKSDPADVLAEFADAARSALKQRVAHIPTNRPWEAGWLSRVETYRRPLSSRT